MRKSSPENKTCSIVVERIASTLLSSREWVSGGYCQPGYPQYKGPISMFTLGRLAVICTFNRYFRLLAIVPLAELMLPSHPGIGVSGASSSESSQYNRPSHSFAPARLMTLVSINCMSRSAFDGSGSLSGSVAEKVNLSSVRTICWSRWLPMPFDAEGECSLSQRLEEHSLLLE